MTYEIIYSESRFVNPVVIRAKSFRKACRIARNAVQRKGGFAQVFKTYHDMRGELQTEFEPTRIYR